MEQSAAMKLMNHHPLWMAYLGEAYLLAGRLEDASALAGGALALSRAHKEQGYEAYALRLLGAITTQRHPPEVESAEAYYRQAMALAENSACARSRPTATSVSGTLYAKIGRREEARAELSAAIDLYRAMDMTFWLPQVEAALAQVEGR